MAIYRGKGGKTDVIPADGDQEFAGSIIVEKDIHAHGNITADGDITINGGITIEEGIISGDGSGLENVPTPFLIAEDCIYLNGMEIKGNHSIPVGTNGMSAGDVTIASGGSVYVPEGSTWTTVDDEDGHVSLESLGIPYHDLINVDASGNVTATSFSGDGSGLYNLNAYTPEEIDSQQLAQNANISANTDAIQANTDAINAIPGEINAYPKDETYNKDEIDASQEAQDTVINTKIGDAPVDGKEYTRKDGGWTELDTTDEGILDAPANGKTYGRKDAAWEEVVVDAYTQGETDVLLNTKADKGDSYLKAEADASQAVQDTAIQRNAWNIQVNADAIAKIPEPIDSYTKAEVDAQQLVQDAEITANTTDIEALENDKADKLDTYTKAEINVQQETQDDAIAVNATNIAKNTTDIAKNVTDIAKNATDIAAIGTGVDALTGSIIYKGSLDATVTPAPADAVVGALWINNYSIDEPATTFPVAAGWEPVTEVKFDDKLIKTETGWDKIESLVGIGVYTSGQVDDLLDEKANVGDSYLKAEADALLNDKANKANTYTKTEVDSQQSAQDVKIDKNIVDIQTNADAIAAIPVGVDAYTKEEIDVQQSAQDTAIQANADAISDLPAIIDAYSKDEIDAQQTAQNDLIDTKATIGDSYLKSEADTLLDNKADAGDSYTKDESDTALDLKADKATTYTKDEVDFSQATQDLEINKKANQDTTYTKDEVDFSQALQDVEIANKTSTVADGCIFLNNQTIENEYTIPLGKNGMSSGPIEFNATVTVPDGTAYHVVDDLGGGITGDGIWAEVGGKAVYDNDIKVNSITVGQGPVNALRNTVVGYQNLKDITTGIRNSAFGRQAGFSITEGEYNTPLGYQALYSNTVGDFNTSVGGFSGSTLTTGNNNILLGYNAQPSTPDVDNEVTIGNDDVTATRLKGEVTTNQDMIVNGVRVGRGNNAAPVNNTALGYTALKNNTTGTSNCAVGHSALLNNVSGDNNCALGVYALTNATGDNNIGIGNNAGGTLTTGSNNIVIGYGAQTTSAGSSNQVVIGNDSVANTYLKGNADVQRTLTVNSVATFQDQVVCKGIPSGGAANVHIAASGALYRATTFYMTEEEVDKKLAIKDKLIEKLSERLDKLEARMKK